MSRDMFWSPIQHTVVGGLKVAAVSRADLVKAFVHDAHAFRERRSDMRARLIFDSNGHGISLYETNAVFRENMGRADVIHADGGFIVSASKLGDTPIPERSATTDMIRDFAAAAQNEGLSFFLLGGSEEVNSRCSELLRRDYPKLNICGRRNGYFQKEDEMEVLAQINLAKPDVLWVGLGKPKEQEFCARFAADFDCAWVVTCGGCYNYITGDYKRAPKWMQLANLEWLHRMFTRPKHLFWRYFITTPHALWLILLKSTQRKNFARNSI